MIENMKDIAELVQDPAVRAELIRFHNSTEEREKRALVIRELLETGPARRYELQQVSGFTNGEVLKALIDLGAKPIDGSVVPQYSL